jgi:hypothetical protein
MAARPTSKQQASDGETAQEAEARQRWINNLFGYWHVCAACFERWWWMTPERHKVQFRAYIKASCAGLLPQDALRAADAEVERAAEHIARVEAQQLEEIMKRDAAMAAQQTEEQLHTEASLPASGPRVRAL